MRRWIVLLAILAGTFRAEGADDAVRRKALSDRTVEWFTARTKLKRVHCSRCRGFGGGPDGSRRWVTCPRCDGRKLVLDTAAYRKVEYDMHSPAWRLRPGASAEAERSYKAEDEAGGTGKSFVASFRLDRVELLDDTHGVSWVFIGTDSVARPTPWILAKEQASDKATWFLYSEDADGPWPEVASVSRATKPLEPAEQRRVEKLLAAEKLTLAVASLGVLDGAFVAALDRGALPARTRVQWEALTIEDATRVVRAILGTGNEYPAVHVVAMAPFRNGPGRVVTAPAVALGMTRDAFDAVPFDRRDSETMASLFVREALAPPDGYASYVTEPTPRPLEAATERAVRAAIEAGKLEHRVATLGRIEDALFVRLTLPGARSLETEEDAATEGVARLARALQGPCAEWGWLRLEFAANWRDDDGHVTVRPLVILSIPGPRLRALNLETLAPREIYAKFTAEAPDSTGWVYWGNR